MDASEQFQHQAQALFRKQEDADGVLRTTLGVLEIFLQRGEYELTQATLEALESDGGQSDSTRARLFLLRTRGALAFSVAEGVHLGHLERAAALAERCRDRQLAWQIAATRGAVLTRLANPKGALESYVEAMSRIRRLLEIIPKDLRNSFLELPACIRCREEFSLLRKKVAGDPA
jgi:tetratricopeptide (TPR) repeat protein